MRISDWSSDVCSSDLPLTVATPAAPVTADKSGVTIGYDTAAPIDLSGSITGIHTSIAIASGPAPGTASIAGDVVTYTPASGYYGADRFTYTATGPGGTAAAARVSLTGSTPSTPVTASSEERRGGNECDSRGGTR